MKRTAMILVMALALCLSTGCVLTKIVTVPLRVVGAAVSVIPVAGNTAHDAIDELAEQIDDFPI